MRESLGISNKFKSFFMIIFNSIVKPVQIHGNSPTSYKIWVILSSLIKSSEK